MRQDWREFSGFGELLCLVLAWTVGVAAMWADHANHGKSPSADNVAASAEHRASTAYFD
jgi:hypothetical protein